jgi:hypothetical protein
MKAQAIVIEATTSGELRVGAHWIALLKLSDSVFADDSPSVTTAPPSGDKMIARRVATLHGRRNFQSRV